MPVFKKLARPTLDFPVQRLPSSSTSWGPYSHLRSCNSSPPLQRTMKFFSLSPSPLGEEEQQPVVSSRRKHDGATVKAFSEPTPIQTTTTTTTAYASNNRTLSSSIRNVLLKRIRSSSAEDDTQDEDREDNESFGVEDTDVWCSAEGSVECVLGAI